MTFTKNCNSFGKSTTDVQDIQVHQITCIGISLQTATNWQKICFNVTANALSDVCNKPRTKL